MEKTRKWRKILAMMLTVVMMLQNAQSVMVFADVTNEQIEQRLAGNQEQTEETQPAQSQVDTRANGEEYKTQSQETQENGNGSTDIGSPESGNATTEAKTSNADVSATITQSVFQADVSGTTCNFVQMTAQITNNDTENPATGVSVKALLNSAQLSWVNGYGTETAGAGAYAVDSNNTADLPDGSADGYDQIVMWTDQTIGAGETVAYQFTAQIIPENLDGVVNAWYVDGTSCSYTWENTEILVPTQAPVEPAPEVAPPQTEPEEKPEVKPEETTPEVTEAPEVTPAPEVTEVPEATPTPETTQAVDDDKQDELLNHSEDHLKIKKRQQKLLAQRGMEDSQEDEGENSQPVVGEGNGSHTKSKDIANSYNTLELEYWVKYYKNGQLIRNKYTGGAIPRDYNVDIKLTFTFDDINKPTENDAKGYTYTIPKLPEGFTLTTANQGEVRDPSGNVAGHYVINGQTVTFDYDESYFETHKDNIKGTFWLRTDVDKTQISDQGQVKFEINGHEQIIKYQDGTLDGQKTYDIDDDGNLVFKIILTAGGDADATNVVVTDTLTGKLTFIDNSFSAIDSDNQNVNIRVEDVEGNLQQKKITVPTIPAGKTVTITYKVASNLSSPDVGEDSNTASWTWGNGNGSGSGGTSSGSASTGKIDLKNQVLTKSSVVDIQNNKIKYKLQINPFALDLIPEGKNPQTLTLTDTLKVYDPLTDTLKDYDPLKMSFDTKSVTIKDSTGKNLITSGEAQWSFNSGVLTVTIPDQKAITLEYIVLALGNVGEQVKIVNDATLIGNYKGHTENTVIIEESGSTIEGDASTIRFKKVGRYSGNPSLTGVKFKLYEYDMNQAKKPGEVEEATSNGDGVVIFGNVENGYKVKSNTLYHIQESQSISGYIQNNEKHYFAMYVAGSEQSVIDALKSKVEELYGKEIGNKTIYCVAGANLGLFYNDQIPAPTSVPFEAEKQLDDDAITDDTKFDFNLMLRSYTPSSKANAYTTKAFSADSDAKAATVSAISREVSALTQNADGSIAGYNQSVSAGSNIKFPNAAFEYEGTYVFEMKEIIPDAHNFIYDKNIKTITVTVERDTNSPSGGLKAILSDTSKIVFKNYSTTSLEIEKNTEEKVQASEGLEFSFNISGRWKNQPLNWEEYSISSTPDGAITKNGENLNVKIRVAKGDAIGSVKLSGLPLGAILTVKEDTDSFESGWSFVKWNIGTGDDITTNPVTKVTLNNKTGQKITATNVYKETGGVTFKANKYYNDWRSSRSFSFKITGLAAVDKNKAEITSIPMPANTTVDIGLANGNGDTKTASFGDVEYTKNGTYYYMVEEVIPKDATLEKGKLVYNGVTYDNKVTYFKVEVSDGENGNKSISLASSGKVDKTDSYKTALGYTGIQGDQKTATADFSNTYGANTSITFKATKSLENQVLGSQIFDFYIKGVRETDYSEKTVQNSGENITFDPILYNQEDLKGVESKTYYYEIGEKTIEGGSITYDSSKYVVEVTVSNDGNGNLNIEQVKVENGTFDKDENSNTYTIKPSSAEKMTTFVNVYEASANVIFTATKQITGKSLEDGEFKFKLTGDGLTNPIEATNIGNKITFKGDSNQGITYTMDDLKNVTEKDNEGHKYRIFHYTVKEDVSGINPIDGIYKKNGVTYDLTTYYVQVKVTDTGTGTLDLEVSSTDKDGKVQKSMNVVQNGECAIPFESSKKANFENTYDASTSIKFVGNKTLENKALQVDQFTFELTGPNVPGSTGLETKKNDADGNFEFSTISYKLDDLTPTGDGYTKKDFEYTIAEKNDSQKGITYDKTTSYKIIVTVENDTTTGQLKPTAKAGTTVLNSTQDATTGTWTFTLPKQKNIATFINTYGATTEIQLAATKELKNKELEAGKYSFKIQQTNNDSGFAESNPATILSGTGTLGTSATVKNGVEGGDAKDIIFPALQYKITELKKSDGTYANDRTFHYIISEENGTEGGVTYSKQKYYVDVKVTDNGDGTFAKEVKVSTEPSVSFDEKQSLTENNGVYSITSSDKYSFTNIYNASTKVQLTGIKKLVNDDAKKTGRKLKDVSNGTSSFKFEITGPNLKDEEGKDVESRTVEIKTENKDSETAVFKFPEITYDITDLKGKSSEDFSYNIVEIAPKEKKGITYDTTTEYTAIVTITDNKNGTLSSSVKLQKKGTEGNTPVTGNMENNVAVYALTGSEATFTNIYNASGSYDFKVNKTLAGRKFQNGDNFKFQIVKTDGNKDEVIGTLKLTADENTSVGKLTGTIAEEKYGLSDVGKTYKYSIQELNPDKKMNGVTISDQRYIIYVTVTDNNDGTLKTNAEWRREVNGEIQTITFDDPAEAITEFQNVYEADGTAQIVAQKTLSPLKLADDNKQFSFTLTRVDSTGKALTGKDEYEETIFNHGSDIIFTPLSYNQDDVGKDFYYTVKENKGTDEGYTYSEDVYNVHVTVGIDKQDSHKLITTKVITDASGATQDAIVFANTYKSTTSVTFQGKKKIVDSTGKALENITLEAGAFTFTVTENGTTVATGKNEADGTITFTPIEYEYSKDSNPLGEHTYIIAEDQPPTGDKYIYDHSSRTVVVNVTDDGTGNLSAAVVTDKSDAMSSDEKCFKNEVISLKFRKTDLTKKDEESTKNLKDATLRLSEYDTAAKQPGTTIAEWTTTDTDYTVSDGLVAGNTYILEEIAVPTGYTTADPIIFTIKNDETRSIEILSESGHLDTTGKIVIMSDAKTGVTVLKVDNDGKGVSGAELAILDGETVVEQWISDGQAKYIEGLAVGKEYILRELSAPTGYRKAADVKFTVEDGKNTSVKMVDSQTTASILKVDEEGNALSGVILEVRDKDSNTLIDRWETDGKAHTISGLTEGVTYILSEISAPAGYTLAKPQEFTLSTTDSVTEIKIENKQNAVTISKKALTGTDSIGGAVLRVLDATGKEVVPKWTTEAGKDKIVTGVLKPNVTYTLEEVSAPSGYAKADNITFAVDESGVLYVNHEKATSVVMRDAKLRLCVSKTDITGKAELPGAVLQIIEKDSKKVVDEWTTTSTPHYTETGLVSGKTYLLHEKTAPAGYGYAEDVEFTLRNDSVVGSEQKVTMYDAPNTVVVTKTDLSGTKELAGAKLQILDTDGKVLESWTSSTEEHRVEVTLEAGKQYILHEVEAPEGYVLAEDVKFTVNKDGSTTRVVMKDAPTGVNISKTDLTGSKEIAGAVLQVLDKDGATVEKWTSDGTTHTVANKLVAGEKYTLHEVSAPAGYRTAKDIEFTVDKTGKTTKVVMKDAPTKASILKTDESGKALSGAQLVVKDSTGKELDKWTSDGKAHEITGLLTVGETYTLSEVSAPSGYTVAPDQTFKMEDKDVIEVTMVDYQTSGSGQITVTKKVTYANGGDFIDLIAQDDTFYVNLFTDAAGKYPYKGALPQAIHLVNASAGSVTFSDLAQGTYYVYETDANGNVINLDQQSMHNGSQFMCTVNGGSNTVKLDLKAGPKEGAVNLENVFYDIPDGYSYKAEININKQVLKGTSQTTVDDTFYAGIFIKDDQGVYNLFTVVPLVQNDTVTVEVPLGGEDGTEPINYYILETDADGNILDLDVFEYEVTGEGTVALSKDNLAGNINLVNKIPEDTDGKLRVQKTDGNGVGLAGASFRLTDEDGSVIDEWTSEASAHELELEPGTYTLTEVQAPTGYTGAGSVTIKVDDDYNFSVSGEIDYSYKGGLLKIVNKATTSTPSSGTPVSGGSTPASYSSALSGKVAVKTGDNTPIGAYAAVLVIAALAIAGGIFYKKKRKNDK